ADGGGQPARADDPRPARPGACAGPGRARPDDRLRPRPEELRLTARINLLPWRAERRKQRQQQFYAMLGVAALAGLVLWFLVNSYYNAQIDGQNRRNAYLKEQISQVEARITTMDDVGRQPARLLRRKDVIEQLQHARSQLVHLFDSLGRINADGVDLTSAKYVGEELAREGRSQSDARVSTDARTLEGSGWM